MESDMFVDWEPSQPCQPSASLYKPSASTLNARSFLFHHTSWTYQAYLHNQFAQRPASLHSRRSRQSHTIPCFCASRQDLHHHAPSPPHVRSKTSRDRARPHVLCPDLPRDENLHHFSIYLLQSSESSACALSEEPAPNVRKQMQSWVERAQLLL